MNLVKRDFLKIAGATLVAACTAVSAQTPDFPTKVVRLVVPYPAGGPVDAMARALSGKLSPLWGQQVIVDNRPGSNETIAAGGVANSPGDGYTLMLATDPVLSLNPFLFKKLPYNPETEFTPITRVAVSNMVLVVPNTFPANTLNEFIAYAKANPGKVAYGSSGIGNGTHLSMAWLAKENKIDMLHVPYKGLAPLLTDMIGGSVQAAFGAVSVVAPFIQAGKIKGLAISGPKRAELLPNVPTLAEAGAPGLVANFYFAVLAPGGLPAAVRDKIAADVKRVASDPQFRKDNFDAFALDAVLDTPQEFAKFLAKDRADAQQKILASGASLD